MRLRDMLRDVKVNGQPLVAEEHSVHKSATRSEREDVPAIWLIPLVIGLAIAADLAAFAVIGERRRALDVAFRVEVAVWSAITGKLGAAITFAWVATKHVFWARNENLLLLNPLSLWLAVLVVLSIWNPRWLRPAAVTASILALCAATAVMIKGFGASQQNAAVLALCVPVNLVIAFGLWRRAMVHSAKSAAE